MSSGQAGSPNLPGKILATHDALAEVDHAFGGAIALAYYAEPRATVNIDLNVFVPVEEAPAVLDPLFGIGAGNGAEVEYVAATVLPRPGADLLGTGPLSTSSSPTTRSTRRRQRRL